MILLNAVGQSAPQKDSSQYKSRTLQFEEANFISSYYHQEGNNAAVTGGIGSEKLTDIANYFDVKLVKYDKKYRKHSFTLGAGIDTYTSASSDMIDLKANSSASHHDVRVYPSIEWEIENEKKGHAFGFNASSSKEFDYLSFGLGVSYSKKSADKNREFSAKIQAYLDQVSMILPVELRTFSGSSDYYEYDDYPTKSRNSFSASFSLSQVVSQRLQLMFLLDLAYQQGQLALPFHRVYFTDNSVKSETLPTTRFKVPIGFRANYFLGNNIVLRSFYRYYHDDWGLTAHMAELETVFKITPFFSVSPFYRYYTQSGVNYFAVYQQHALTDTYYTSNYDLSKFNSSFPGAGIRFAPEKGVLGIPHIAMAELRYGHYTRSTSLNSNIVTLNLKFK
jgi:hypothetical protein